MQALIAICHYQELTRLWENRQVNILDGVCDSCDLCGCRDCEYFDDTEEGSLRFQKGLAELHGSVEGQCNDRTYQEQLRRKHRFSL